ncbi:MAG: hypothetical protein PHV36_11180 [Elusimicrobiales bacterium]|nr:hypothetical protein [Elusimicrobiales bacterium]
MKIIAKTFTLFTFLAAVSLPAAAGQSKVLDSLSGQKAGAAIPLPGPAYGLTRDVFREVDACSILNAQFIIQPFMKDALSMLKPCLAGVSDLTGKAKISVGAVKNGKAIEITVLGSKNKDVADLIKGSLAKRNDQVFGYPASVVVIAAEPKTSILPRDVFTEVEACSIVDAQFFMQPFMKDALKMLKPCLDGISKISAYAPISVAETKNGKAIEITVLGEKNDYARSLIDASIAKRGGQLFGYPAEVVLNAGAPL